MKSYVAKRAADKVSITKAGEYKALEFKSRIVEYEGGVMNIATRDVVTIPPTMTIKGAAETMTRYRFRRLPVTDPGTKRLLGMIGSSDIIDFLGGGEKVKIILKKYGGNFLAAINEPVRSIMVTDVLSLGSDATLKEALNIIRKTRVGGVVIVDEDKRVEGILTERDFVFMLAGKVTGKKVGEYMTKKVVTVAPGATVGEAMRVMTKHSFRRLPVVENEKLAGLVTTRNIIDFVGRNNIFSKIVENRLDEVLSTPVSEIMRTSVPEIESKADLGKAAELIESMGVGTICVLENQKLVGILTERDIVLALGK